MRCTFSVWGPPKLQEGANGPYKQGNTPTTRCASRPVIKASWMALEQNVLSTCLICGNREFIISYVICWFSMWGMAEGGRRPSREEERRNHPLANLGRYMSQHFLMLSIYLSSILQTQENFRVLGLTFTILPHYRPVERNYTIHIMYTSNRVALQSWKTNT